MLRNPTFCSFASFLIVSLTPTISKLDSSKDFTIIMISFAFLFEIVNAVAPDPKNFF